MVGKGATVVYLGQSQGRWPPLSQILIRFQERLEALEAAQKKGDKVSMSGGQGKEGI